MGYLPGTDSESVGSAVCFKLGMLAALYLHKQTEKHFCSHEGKQDRDSSANPPEGGLVDLFMRHFGKHQGSWWMQVTYRSELHSDVRMLLKWFSAKSDHTSSVWWMKHTSLKQVKTSHSAFAGQCSQSVVGCRPVLWQLTEGDVTVKRRHMQIVKYYKQGQLNDMISLHEGWLQIDKDQADALVLLNSWQWETFFRDKS